MRVSQRGLARSVGVLIAVLILETIALGTGHETALADPIVPTGPTVFAGTVRAAQLSADLRSLPDVARSARAPVRAPKGPHAGAPAASKQAAGATAPAGGTTGAAAPMPAPITSFAGLDKAGWGNGY